MASYFKKENKTLLPKSLAIIYLLIPVSIHAMPCPNGSIIYKDDSISEVIKRCGEPLSRRNTIKTLIQAQQWNYYKYNAYDRTNTRITFLFNGGHVANINIFANQSDEQNVTSTNICGENIHIGSNLSSVLHNCGRPNWQQTLQNASVAVTELIYNGAFKQKLTFEGNRLVDIE